MRIETVEQGSEAWERLRKGRPTASNFVKFLTPRGLRLSQSDTANRYACQLAAERKGVENPPRLITVAMENGIELEPEAVEAYENRTGNACEKVGFVFPDETTDWGCSPDRIVFEKGTRETGLLEVKCPEAETLIFYLADGAVPGNYFLQVQAQLWITGLPWCDFFAWHPLVKDSFLVRVLPEPAVFDAMDSALPKFCQRVNEIAAKFETWGAE